MTQMWIFFFIILCITGGLFATDITVETQPTVYAKENHDVQIPCSSNMLFSRTIVKWKSGATLENSILLVFLDHGAVGGPLFEAGYDLLKNGSLLINNVTTTNSGLYFCIVEDSLGNTGYNTSRLVVNLKPVLSQLVINFCGMHNPNCTRKFQTNVTLPLMCTARSERAAVSLNWKSNVSDVPQRIQSLTEEQDGVFISNAEINVQLIEAVQYVCYVLNTEEYNLPESSIFINISPVHLYPDKGQLAIEASSRKMWIVPVTLLCTIIAVAIISVIAGILYKKFHNTYSQVPSLHTRGFSATSGIEGIYSSRIQTQGLSRGESQVPIPYYELDNQVAIPYCDRDSQASNPYCDRDSQVPSPYCDGDSPVSSPYCDTEFTGTLGNEEMHSDRSQVPLKRDYLSCGAIYQSLSSEDLQAFHQYLKRTSDIDLQDPEEHSQRTSDIEFQTKMTIKATNGATVTLPCEATDAKDVMWIKRTQQGKNNLIYLGGHTFGSTDDFVYSNGNLAIAELGELHQGLYITTSLQQFQDNSVATAYNVICDESCRYINYTVDYGSTIILPVDYSLRNESDKVKWSTDSFYGDITETGNKGKYNLQQNGNLLIRHVDDNDNCIFHCKLYDSIIYYSVTVKSEPVYR